MNDTSDPGPKVEQEQWAAPKVTEYVDRVSIAVIPAEFADETESANEWLLMSLGSVRVDAVWLEDQIDGYVKALSGDSCCGPYPPYALDIKRGRISWGASAATIAASVAIGWMASGITGNAAFEGLKALGRLVRDRLFDPTIPQELTEDEALQTVRQFIYNRYSVPPDLVHARHVKCNLLEGTAEMELFDHQGINYSCKLYVPPGGGAAVSEISRTSSDGTPLVIRRPGGKP